MPNSTVCLSFDFDALSVWFSYDQTSPNILMVEQFIAYARLRNVQFRTMADVTAQLEESGS